jgi:hypothetical protein
MKLDFTVLSQGIELCNFNFEIVSPRTEDLNKVLEVEQFFNERTNVRVHIKVTHSMVDELNELRKVKDYLKQEGATLVENIADEVKEREGK